MIPMSTKSELEELFLRKKPVKLLMALKVGGPTKYISMLSKETDCTYSHTVKLLEHFGRLGLVYFDKMGRVKFIKLTPDGEELAGYFENVLRKFSKIDVKKAPSDQSLEQLRQKQASKPALVSQSKPVLAKPLKPIK